MISDTDISTIKKWLGTGSIDIFGPQFSGKDTQSENLAQILGGSYISSGNIFRSSQETPSETLDILAKGGFAPTDDFMRMVLPYFSRPEFEGKPMVLSSVGRGPGEPASVVEVAEETNHPIKAVIHLVVDNATIAERWEKMHEVGLREKRADDTKEGLAQRLRLYEEVTVPEIIGFYRDRGLLIEVDGAQSREEVTQKILSKLLERAQQE